MLLNLISNRSFIDLYQYPIFPLLNFYDKNGKYIPRNFHEHIGFQTGSEDSLKRKERFEALSLNPDQSPRDRLRRFFWRKG